jgi:hypothetical protein
MIPNCREANLISGSQATEQIRMFMEPAMRLVFAVAPRDTCAGVGIGRETGPEAGEAIRWGHFFSGTHGAVARPICK